MKNILVPFDFSPFANLAFEKAKEIAKKFDSKITLLSVIGSDIDTSGMDWERAQEAHDEEEFNVTAELNKIKESSSDKDLDVSVNLVHDPSPSEGIISFAKSNKIDLIIMGSHGRSGVKKLVLGSVASKVVAKSENPVLIVKQPKIEWQHKKFLGKIWFLV